MLLHVLLYVCTAMPPLQGAVRPDTLGSWVSVSRGSDGTSALLKWKDIDGAVKDIEYHEIVSKAADQAWRAPSRLLALHLLTDTLVPELLRANLQASDELCAVRSYGAALAMLPGSDQRRILREAGCDEDADLTTMEGIPLIKKLEVAFKVVAGTMRLSEKYAGYDVHKQFHASEWNQPLWRPQIVRAMTECGFEVADRPAAAQPPKSKQLTEDENIDEKKAQSRKVMLKFAPQDTSEMGVWYRVVLDHWDYIRATNTTVKVMDIMQGELDDVPKAMQQVLDDQNTADGMGIVDDCVTNIVREIIRLRDVRERLGVQERAKDAEVERERKREADRQRREDQRRRDEDRKAKDRAAAIRVDEDGDGTAEAEQKDAQHQRELRRLHKQLRALKHGDDWSGSEDEKKGPDYQDVTTASQSIDVITLTCLRGADPATVAKFINAEFTFNNLANMYALLAGACDGKAQDRLNLCVDAASVQRMFPDGQEERRLKIRGAAVSVVVSRSRHMQALAQAIRGQPEHPTTKGKGKGMRVHLGNMPPAGLFHDVSFSILPPNCVQQPYVSFWGDGRADRKGARVVYNATNATDPQQRMAQMQAVTYQGLWVAAGTTVLSRDAEKARVAPVDVQASVKSILHADGLEDVEEFAYADEAMVKAKRAKPKGDKLAHGPWPLQVGVQCEPGDVAQFLGGEALRRAVSDAGLEWQVNREHTPYGTKGRSMTGSVPVWWVATNVDVDDSWCPGVHQYGDTYVRMVLGPQWVQSYGLCSYSLGRVLSPPGVLHSVEVEFGEVFVLACRARDRQTWRREIGVQRKSGVATQVSVMQGAEQDQYAVWAAQVRKTGMRVPLWTDTVVVLTEVWNGEIRVSVRQPGVIPAPVIRYTEPMWQSVVRVLSGSRDDGLGSKCLFVNVYGMSAEKWQRIKSMAALLRIQVLIVCELGAGKEELNLEMQDYGRRTSVHCRRGGGICVWVHHDWATQLHKVLDDPHAMMVTARTRERKAVLVGGHMPQRAYSSAFRAVMQRVHQALQKERADFVVMLADWNRHLKESGTAVHEVQRLQLCVVANGTEARLHKDWGVVHPTMQNSKVCYLPAVADHPVVVLQARQGAVEDGRECAERGPTVRYQRWSAYEKKVHSDAMELLTVPDSSVARWLQLNREVSMAVDERRVQNRKGRNATDELLDRLQAGGLLDDAQEEVLRALVAERSWMEEVANRKLLNRAGFEAGTSQLLKIRKSKPFMSVEAIWDSTLQQVVRGEAMLRVIAQEAQRKNLNINQGEWPSWMGASGPESQDHGDRVLTASRQQLHEQSAGAVMDTVRYQSSIGEVAAAVATQTLTAQREKYAHSVGF